MNLLERIALRKISAAEESPKGLLNTALSTVRGLKDRAASAIRGWRSRVKPANMPGMPQANQGVHPMANYYNFADRAINDPDTLSWSNTGSLPFNRFGGVWDGKYKCNAFVQQAAAAAFGNKSILQHPKLGRTFTANELHRGLGSGTPFDVGGGYNLHPITADEAAMLPGSIVTSGEYLDPAATGHVGITPGFGVRKAISAASAPRAKGVSYNDWGFRKGDTNLYGMLIPAGEDPAAYKSRQLEFAKKIQNASRDNKTKYFRTVKTR